ncbi:MAG: T9SS type A sorting domain-containing protein [Bacteroidales bacterium]|nr:T9SS type A sorting domain-containing protein [Bacteroidales bacterium]
MNTKLRLKFALAFMAILTTLQLYATDSQWVKSYGGVADENFSVTAKDATGNLFVATRFSGTCDFNPNPNKTANLTTSGAVSVGISKFDANGNFLWVKGVEGPSTEVKALTIDKEGNILFGGFFGTSTEGTATTDFNPDPTQATNLIPGYLYSDYEKRNLYFNDGYVCKWDNNGNFVWVKQFTGALNEEVYELKTDEANNVILTGHFYGFAGVTVDCNPDTVDEFKLVADTDYGAQFITKLDADGKFVWAKKLDGTGVKYITDIDVDNANNYYFSGYFGNTLDADPGAGVVTLTSQTWDSNGGKSDDFIIKLAENGDFVLAKSFGDVTNSDYLSGICVDKQTGEMYVGGFFTGTMKINTLLQPSNGSYDPFIAKFDASGNIVWFKNWGGTKYDTFIGMDRDDAGNIFTTGMFSEVADMDPGAAVLNFTSAGNYEAYINKFDKDGNLVWAKQVGGMGNDWGNSVTALGDGNVFASGTFSFAFDFGQTTLETVGGYDTWLFHSSSTTDVREIRLDANITVYPNPTFGEAVLNLNKEYSNMKVNIRNMVGGEVSSSNYQDVSSIRLALPKTNGIYLVELNDGKGLVQTLKVVKR